MEAEVYQRYSDIFDRFSSERNVGGVFQGDGGWLQSYQTTVRLMDKTSFILAMIELSKPSTQTVKVNEL